jgi:hypothetical protein
VAVHRAPASRLPLEAVRLGTQPTTRACPSGRSAKMACVIRTSEGLVQWLAPFRRVLVGRGPNLVNPRADSPTVGSRLSSVNPWVDTTTDGTAARGNPWDYDVNDERIRR